MMAFDFLGLVAGGAKVIYDCFSEQSGRVRHSLLMGVIELKWEQDLESPPFAAHTWFSQSPRRECSWSARASRAASGTMFSPDRSTRPEKRPSKRASGELRIW
jgi:hypothetical protein